MTVETRRVRGRQATKVLGRQESNKKYDAALRAARSMRSDSDRGDLAPVAKLLEEAHTHGDKRATYALGTWHFHGQFFNKDEKRGFSLMLEAAENFVPDACFDVAVSYETGKGVRKSLKKAGIYYFRAMMLGEKQSVAEVGRLFYWGIGVPENRGIAKELLNFSG
ncbi:SEL1-like repeat protein [Xanthomonas sp. SS]|uniref:tetratricopeptide repeat protein n=1 Tax=Xanthomonas sp. SS TaxID=2724122 RepID=UPI00163B49CE|nr:SEL1-like repeat protein [Xanthomonas sp. SS]